MLAYILKYRNFFLRKIRQLCNFDKSNVKCIRDSEFFLNVHHFIWWIWREEFYSIEILWDIGRDVRNIFFVFIKNKKLRQSHMVTNISMNENILFKKYSPTFLKCILSTFQKPISFPPQKKEKRRKKWSRKNYHFSKYLSFSIIDSTWSFLLAWLPRSSRDGKRKNMDGRKGTARRWRRTHARTERRMHL